MASELFGDESISVRKMEDCLDDYTIMAKWLSDPDVCEYYEGKSKLYDLEKVKTKFAHRTRGESDVIMCIISCDNEPVGFLQFYPTEPYCESEILDMSAFQNPYGIDIVIGETRFWGTGTGTKVMKMTVDYLFGSQNADIIFIDPQTWNKRAIRCYEKSGFKPLTVIEKRELHDDEYKDSLIMCITRKPLINII